MYECVMKIRTLLATTWWFLVWTSIACGAFMQDKRRFTYWILLTVPLISGSHYHIDCPKKCDNLFARNWRWKLVEQTQFIDRRNIVRFLPKPSFDRRLTRRGEVVWCANCYWTPVVLLKLCLTGDVGWEGWGQMMAGRGGESLSGVPS